MQTGIKIPIILLSIILLLVPAIAFAANTTNQSANGTTDQNQTTPTPGTQISWTEIFKGIYNFLVQSNPILLLIFGGVLVIVSKFAKWIGIILIIIALVSLILSVV